MLPHKQAQIQAWDTLCIDLIDKYRMTSIEKGRKYTMKGKKDKDIYLQVITMVDSAIGCISICSMPAVRIDLVASPSSRASLVYLTT